MGFCNTLSCRDNHQLGASSFALTGIIQFEKLGIVQWETLTSPEMRAVMILAGLKTGGYCVQVAAKPPHQRYENSPASKCVLQTQTTCTYFMTIANGWNDLGEKNFRFFVADAALRFQVVVQLAARCIFHNDHDFVLVLKHCKSHMIDELKQIIVKWSPTGRQPTACVPHLARHAFFTQKL